MIKVTRQARFVWRKFAALLAVAITVGAYADGATGYQWLKNGKIVEGATERTLEVSYGESGTTNTYQCVSYYNLFGYGASAEAQIENLPSGTVMIWR